MPGMGLWNKTVTNKPAAIIAIINKGIAVVFRRARCTVHEISWISVCPRASDCLLLISTDAGSTDIS